MLSPGTPYTKEMQTRRTRTKPLARSRGAISTKVRKELKQRSNGKCERQGCHDEAVHAAHITRRWKLDRTTVNDVLHLCLSCHHFADHTKDGREWLKTFEKLRETPNLPRNEE